MTWSDYRLVFFFFFQQKILQYYTVPDWLNLRIRDSEYRGAPTVYMALNCGFLTLQRVSAPKRHVVQGLTIICK